jgi:hypothetical protein
MGISKTDWPGDKKPLQFQLPQLNHWDFLSVTKIAKIGINS